LSTRSSFQTANLLKISGKLLKIKFCAAWEGPEYNLGASWKELYLLSHQAPQSSFQEIPLDSSSASFGNHEPKSFGFGFFDYSITDQMASGLFFAGSHDLAKVVTAN
jgi:hypothetical protein